jgi:mRNA-degrading endonuclease toxin of MazEF toxin-antitoxin module
MWQAPEPGDIVWCRFPEMPRDIPGPKPRPVLVLTVDEREDGVIVEVDYGTSQRLDRMRPGEFAIRKGENQAAYVLAGISYDTKFNMRQTLTLPWDPFFFAVAPSAPHGQHPKLGTLHPSMMKLVISAANAVRK